MHGAAAALGCAVQLFINNEWVDPKQGGKLDVIDPRTGDTIKQIASAGVSLPPVGLLRPRLHCRLFSSNQTCSCAGFSIADSFPQTERAAG